VDFLKKLEKGPKAVLTSMSEELDTDFIGTLRTKVDFNGFIYGVFENEKSVLVTSIDGAACTFKEDKIYSVRFSWGAAESTQTHFLHIQEKK
jgi:hypothetical protein